MIKRTDVRFSCPGKNCQRCFRTTVNDVSGLYTGAQPYRVAASRLTRVSTNILTGSHAKRAPEPLNKMALINEPDFGSNEGR